MLFLYKQLQIWVVQEGDRKREGGGGEGGGGFNLDVNHSNFSPNL